MAELEGRRAVGRLGQPSSSCLSVREKGAQGQGTLWLLPTGQPVLAHRNLTFNLVAEGRPQPSRLQAQSSSLPETCYEQ